MVTVNMTEHSTSNLATMLPVNPEAHTSLQLLHRHSSDEDDGDDEEEEEEDDDDVDEHKENETENGNGGDPPTIEPKNDHLNHSISAPAITLSPTSSFPVGRGRGSRKFSSVSLLNSIISKSFHSILDASCSYISSCWTKFSTCLSRSLS